jgi:hypothetical protein
MLILNSSDAVIGKSSRNLVQISKHPSSLPAKSFVLELVLFGPWPEDFIEMRKLSWLSFYTDLH